MNNLNYTSIEDNPWDGIFINSGNINITGNTIGATTGNNAIIINTPVASASATMSGGVISGLTLEGGGSGYTSTPILTFSSGGATTPATASATISGGVVTGITLLTGGAGYTSTPSVLFDGATYSTSHGMIQNSAGIVNITNNNIGSITTVGSSYYSHGFESIYVRGVAANLTISHNLIGSLTSANSIHISTTAATSPQKQDVYGIYTSGTGTTLISDNTIANITNAYTGNNSGARTRGILATAGSNTINNNTVRNITSPNTQTSTTSAASIIGISVTSTTAGTNQTIEGNTVFDLSNTNSTVKSYMTGIYFAGPTTGSHSIKGNLIHSINLSTTNYTSNINGIFLNSGATVICANNIVVLGGNSLGYLINGIWDGSSASHIMNVYFNTIYIGGTVSSGTTSSTSCLWNANNTSTRNYRNNVFYNARSGGTTGFHYAIRLSGNTNTTIDYNDYYVSGTQGMLGSFSSSNKSTLADWKAATSQDINSLNVNPSFASPGGTTAENYQSSATIPGITIAGISTDYNGITRGSTPKMGALEVNNYVWQGSTSTDFATASNWAGNVVPLNGSNISFAVTPNNHCVLDSDRSLRDITNAQGTKYLDLNGHQMELTGSLIFSNNAKIDASGNLSSIAYTGSAAQSIPSGAFVNDIIDMLEINNSHGVAMNGDLIINQSLELNDGLFAIGAHTLTMNGSISLVSGTLSGGLSTNIVFGGSGASTSLPVIQLNNLTINRANGVSLDGSVVVNGALNLTSGILSLGANSFTLAGSTVSKTSGSIDASNASASLIFANASALTLPASVFSADINNLTLSGSGGVTFTSDFTVNGILDLQSANPTASKGIADLWDGLETKTITMGANATTIGIGDVTGIVKRVSFTPNIVYTFGNQYTTVTFPNTGTLPTSWKIKISLGSAPGWKTGAVQRYYDFLRTDGSGSLPTVKLHYLDAELNSNSEADLVFLGRELSTSTSFEYGKVNNSISENWVSLSGDINFAPTSFGEREWTLSDRESAVLSWNGGTPGSETDWNSNMNWTSGTVPGVSDDVYIEAGKTYYPTLPTSTTINSINIADGATVNGGSATTLTLNGANAAWYNRGAFNKETATIVFVNSAATMAGETDFYNVNINSGAHLTLTTSSIMRISGSLTNNGTLDATEFPNTIVYNGGAQTVINPNGATSGYYNLTLSGNAIKTMPSVPINILGDFLISDTASVTAGNAISTTGDFTINSEGSFTTGNYNHTFGGLFTNESTFIGSPGYNITLNGSTSQGVSGTTTFDNLTINNSQGITLGGNIIINNVLTLTNGILNTGSNAVVIADGASISGANSTRYINGICKKGGNDAFSFPIGHNGQFAPISMSAPSNVLDTFTAEYFNANPNTLYDISLFDAPIERVCGVEYWTLDRTYGASSVSVTLSWDSRSSGITDPDLLLVARWDGTKWVSHGNFSTTGDVNAGTITSDLVSNFSPFTLATEDGEENPLPVSIVDFKGVCNGNEVALNWRTASESNNNFFTLERSFDQTNWDFVSHIDGSGNTNNLKLYSFIDVEPDISQFRYYRLKQTDFDGKISYSKSIFVACAEENNAILFIKVFPNPTTGILNVSGFDSEVQYQVYNGLGLMVQSGIVNKLKKNIALTGCKTGLYTIMFSSGTQIKSLKVIVE